MDGRMIGVETEIIGDYRYLCGTWLVDGIELRHSTKAGLDVDIGETFKTLQDWFDSGVWRATVAKWNGWPHE